MPPKRRGRAAEERTPPAVRARGEGGLLGAGLGCAHLPQEEDVFAHCGGEPGQGSGVEHIQVVQTGTEGACYAGRRYMLILGSSLLPKLCVSRPESIRILYGKKYMFPSNMRINEMSTLCYPVF